MKTTFPPKDCDRKAKMKQDRVKTGGVKFLVLLWSWLMLQDPAR